MGPLSIGLLNLNQADLTIDVLSALAPLANRGWTTQLVVVDQGSNATDRLKLTDWLDVHRGQFSDISYVQAETNLGAAAGRNEVLKRAEGARVLILDNDLELQNDTEWLSSLWRTLDENPAAGIVGPMLVFARAPEIVQAAGIGLTRLGRVGYLHRGDPIVEVSPTLERVVASPAACWLMEQGIQEEIGGFPTVYWPMQYWDVDYCMQLDQAGYHVLCDRRLHIRHIVNVTTRSLGDRMFARTAVRHGMLFRERWADRLNTIDAIEDRDIYWGPIPRP